MLLFVVVVVMGFDLKLYASMVQAERVSMGKKHVGIKKMQSVQSVHTEQHNRKQELTLVGAKRCILLGANAAAPLSVTSKNNAKDFMVIDLA